MVLRQYISQMICQIVISSVTVAVMTDAARLVVLIQHCQQQSLPGRMNPSEHSNACKKHPMPPGGGFSLHTTSLDCREFRDGSLLCYWGGGGGYQDRVVDGLLQGPEQLQISS